MKSHIEEKNHTVDFLYKFAPGVASNSFGIYVAKLAGINDKVLKRAEMKAEEFNITLDYLTHKVRNIRKWELLINFFNIINILLIFIYI